MKKRVVTCPETGEDEQIGYIPGRDDHMLVVIRCTRFDPVEAISCETACADEHNERLCELRDRARSSR